MKGAQCKINKAGLPVLSEVEGLIEACNLIDQMKIAEQNQDVQGDLYEYMLGHMQFAGRGGAGGVSSSSRHRVAAGVATQSIITRNSFL